MTERLQIDAEDILAATRNQRDAGWNEASFLYGKSKALERRVQDRDTEIAALNRRIEELESDLDAMKKANAAASA